MHDSILVTHPTMAKMWHPTKNNDYKIEEITFGSEKVVWWYFPYDDIKTGKHFDFEWQQQGKMVNTGMAYEHCFTPAFTPEKPVNTEL